MTRYLTLALVCALLASPLSASRPPKGANLFYAGVSELMDNTAHHKKHLPFDALDKIFSDIFQRVIPDGSVLIPLGSRNAKNLSELVSSLAKRLNIKTPHIYFSPDNSNIDIKCITYNDNSALLLHNLTFLRKRTKAFRGYIKTAMQTIAKTIYTHQEKRKKRNRFNAIMTAISTALPFGAALLMTRKSAPWKRNIALALAGIVTGVPLTRIWGARGTTMSYQRVPSFDNQEEAREDLFPGNTPDSIIQPVYHAGPEHAVRLIVNAQQYIDSRNKEWEEEQQIYQRDDSTPSPDDGDEEEYDDSSTEQD